MYNRKQIHRGADSPYIQKAGDTPSLGQNHLSFGSTLKSVLLNTSCCTVLMIEMFRGLATPSSTSSLLCSSSPQPLLALSAVSALRTVKHWFELACFPSQDGINHAANSTHPLVHPSHSCFFSHSPESSISLWLPQMPQHSSLPPNPRSHSTAPYLLIPDPTAQLPTSQPCACSSCCCNPHQPSCCCSSFPQCKPSCCHWEKH